MPHPFQAIPADKYWQVFLPLLILTLILMTVLSAVPLKPDIVHFELNAHEVLTFWDVEDKSWAAFSLGLDFLYLVVYSTTISLACIWVAKVFPVRGLLLASVGIGLAWGQWLAALLDVVENIALISILFDFGMNVSPQVAKWCAIPKFGLITLGLLYVGLGAVVTVMSHWFGVRTHSK